MIKDNDNTWRIGAGGQELINIAKANMAAYLTNFNEAVPLTAALDCGRAESVSCLNHINENHSQ